MREKDVHKLIEEQNPEAKQRIWEKVRTELNLGDLQYGPATKATAKMQPWKWSVIAVALICVITLSIVLPLTLQGGGSRFCDIEQYTREPLGQTLKEYFAANNKNLLYVDWYGNAEDVVTDYAYIKGNKSDIVYLQEFIVNGETGENITLTITDNKTRVDVLELYFICPQEKNVQGIVVNFGADSRTTRAKFEYKGYVYYLETTVRNGQELITNVIEDMLK